jgi:hypothetical protein
MAKGPSVDLLTSICDFSGSDGHTAVGLIVIFFIFLISFALIFVFWFKGIKSLGSVGKFPVLAFTVGLATAFMYCLSLPSLVIMDIQL